ncbi:uncharacterized protein EI97DRAFT_431445 [Westerdykella ornata]|uniref:Signal peptidase complex subunit 2 n=1 Tax=Westerdykella ornata TaxID=318751 RepID=A0A6A6JPV9_WESOR|nr:uncharacterized protein EI97DRAFT_431445 [Westerdykella ornata]KAF2278173.1 hypothetical protein EI97DRAFT_431445 [Westerdykella ornata]
MAAPSTKIAVHSLSDLKNTTDDFIPLHLHNLKFRQIHTKTDVRLALGYSAVLISAALFYFDWKFGWAVTKPWTAPAVVAYFVLNGVFTYWVWWVESGLVYEGVGKTGRIAIRTSTKKHTPIYHLTATFTPSSSSSATPQTLTLHLPFTTIFTSEGSFAPKPFQQFLASSIPVIGAADPSNVVEEIGRGSETPAQGGGAFNVSASNAVEILEQLKRSARANQRTKASGSSGAAAVGQGGQGRRRK